jgi:FlaA1/EpsC-like NDP-sugar epimerase
VADYLESSLLRRARWRSAGLAARNLALQTALAGAALAGAFLLRYDLRLHSPDGALWWGTEFLPLAAIVLPLQAIVFWAMRLPRTAWRYVSLSDLLQLLVAGQIALALSVAALYGVQAWAAAHALDRPLATLPQSVLLLDFLLTVAAIGGAKMLIRLLHEESRSTASSLTRLLIIGAGDAAAAVLREIARMPEQKYRVVGLLDDAPDRQRLRIHNVPVLGTIESLPAVCARERVGEILIALPERSKPQMQRIVALCRAAQVAGNASGKASTGVKFRTIPSLADLIAGQGNANQIRDVSVNDVLGRDAVALDLAAVGGMIHGKRVLVSGAGGSIGSELARTIAGFGPALLVLVDKAENAMFEIERELARSFPSVPLVAAIGDISDAIRVEQIFAEHTPALVFHAAAHKHVPLAEKNPGECVRNNVIGTKTLADAAARAGVAQFVMISTDKAVNPTSIMGATKRCAEIYIQSLARRSATNFITVRFGNVLGSNGSVVPIFKQQIAAGGPVTVTHPEMRRYFMTIPEASQLVLQAAALGERGEIFILDMGAPVRILDLARDLITLSGLRPEVDIPIVFTGLRPGEKLYEELSIRGENMQATRHPKIAVWKSTPTAPAAVQRMIDDLESLQHSAEREPVIGALTAYLPEMTPWEETPRIKVAASEPRPLGSGFAHDNCVAPSDAQPLPYGRGSEKA